MQDLAVLLLLVLIPSAVVFIAALLGNLITFGNRYTNAAISAVIPSAAVVIAVLAAIPSASLKGAFVLAFVAGAVVFLVDLIGNQITFTNRLLNALTTTALFAIPFGAFIIYWAPVLLAVMN